jgi:hypothetical protein
VVAKPRKGENGEILFYGYKLYFSDDENAMEADNDWAILSMC